MYDVKIFCKSETLLYKMKKFGQQQQMCNYKSYVIGKKEMHDSEIPTQTYICSTLTCVLVESTYEAIYPNTWH